MAAKVMLTQGSQLKPYLAPALLKAQGQERDAALLKIVVNEMERYIKSTPRVTRDVLQSVYLGQSSTIFFHAVVYRERIEPSWDAANAYQDVAHQLMLVGVRNEYAAICASEASLRTSIVKRLTSVEPLSADQINAFVGPDAAAIWLDGIHTPTAVKANTKFMTGQSLEYAIDPLGDQTYRYSAIRTRPAIAGLKDGRGRNLPIGAAPLSSRIWLGRPDNGASFASDLSAILTHVAKKQPTSSLYSLLATPVSALSAASNAYAVALVPPELLAEENIGQQEREAAIKWAYNAKFDVRGSKKGASLELTASVDGKRLGDLALDIQKAKRGSSVVVNVSWLKRENDLAAEQAECERALSDAERLKVYYDSGHTLAQGLVYAPGFTDHFFPWSFAKTAGFLIGDEEPTDANNKFIVADIGTTKDNSLFGLVVKKMYRAGWLACDDGSMELADFIHLDPTREEVTLIQVKASSSDITGREASVSDYEIVTSQAIKNLRHLYVRNLYDELVRGKGKKIGASVWKDGKKQKDRSGFLAAINRLSSRAQKKVVILQPRLTKTEHDVCRAGKATPARDMRMKQLNTLLLGARLSAMACGAELEVVGDDR